MRMKVTIDELEAYLFECYGDKVDEQSLFMKLVEEMGEVAEILNKRSGRKKADSEDLAIPLGKELADVIHYVVAIAAVNNLDLNDIIFSKDKEASLKYNHDIDLEQFISRKRREKNG